MEGLFSSLDLDIDMEFKTAAKVPSLLSTHLDSPLRTNALDYCKTNWNSLFRSQIITKKHPYSFNYIIRDLQALYNKNQTAYPSIMNAGHFGILNSTPIESGYLSKGRIDLEKFFSLSVRNLELQVASTKLRIETYDLDPLYTQQDDFNKNLNSSSTSMDHKSEQYYSKIVQGLDIRYGSNLQSRLDYLIANKKAIIKELPPILLHQFTWYNLLHQAILLTGLINDHDDLSHDLSRYNSPWKLINKDKEFGESNIYSLNQANLKLLASRNLFQIIDDSGNVHLGSREHLLMMADVFIQRFNLLLSGHLASIIGYKHYLEYEELNTIFKWGDVLLSNLHNHAFNVLSKWEPLCVGVFLKYADDQFCDKESFLHNIQTEIIEEFQHVLPNISQLLMTLESFMFKLHSKSYHKLSQAFGLFRIWGHPNIDPIKGIVKLKQIAQQKRLINKKKVRQIFCIFMEKFCLDYRSKKGMWPKLNVSKLRTSNHIRRAIESNSTISLTSPQYNRHDWINVSFEKTFDITEKLNLSDLLSDKALSLTFPELIAQVQKYKNIGLATEKSVIVQWLKSTLHDPNTFLQDINDNGFGIDNDLFGVCPKERELKLIARFFGLATLKKRMYIVLTEAMIAEYIVPHFPQITMMDDAVTLSKKFFDHTKLMSNTPSYFSSKSYINIVTNIDFQKWNTYMRKEETNLIFYQMDRLFGFDNCILRTHEMFEKAQLYLADGTFIPEFVSTKLGIKMRECKYVWTNHLGGIEGLRQKGWTIFTVCVLISVMELHPKSKFSLMGQGDNQVLIVHYSSKFSKDEISRMHKAMIESLDQELKLIGPPLKKEETWSSSSLFIYGKFIIYNGCPLSLSQKKICRFFPMSNEGFPTIETAISSIAANCSAACSSDISPIIPFVCSSFWYAYIFQEMFQINYLGISLCSLLFGKDNMKFFTPTQQGGRKRQQFKLSLSSLNIINQLPEEFLTVLMLFPKVLGGYPVGFLGNYLIKGFPDPLTENLSIIKILYPLLTIKEKSLIAGVLSPHINPDLNYDYLFANPTGLNLLSPTTPGDIVKSTVTRFIHDSDWIINNYVREFLTLSHENQRDLVQALASMKPLNPLIGNAILDSTIIGRAHQVMEQLNKTSTLIKLTAKNGDDLLSRVKAAEGFYLISVLYHIFFKSDYDINLNNCSRIEAQKLREVSWKNDQITGVTVPYPIEFLTIQSGFLCDSHNSPDKGYILMKQTIQHPEKDWFKAEYIGDAIPYIGSRTIDKVKAYGNKIAKNSSPLLKKVSKIQSLIGWATNFESELAKCIRRLFSAITDLPPELLNPEESSISGSVEHRFASTAVNRGGNVELMFNFGTFLSLATDTFTAYAKGSINVNLHFQAALSYGTSWFSSMRSINSDCQTTCYHMHQDCLDCIIPINEDKIDVDPAEWNLLIKSNDNSAFCWIPKEKILGESLKLYHHYPEFSSEMRNNQSIEYNHMLRSCKSAAKETMIKFRQLSLEVGDGKLSSRSGWLFPVSWVFKLNPIVFFVSLLVELKCFFIFRQFESKIVLTNNALSFDREFRTFIENIPPIVFGTFSSWFQNSHFLDFISGSPYFVRPPLRTTFTRTSCGVCIRNLLLRIIELLEEGLYDHQLFNSWKLFFTEGEESLDSNPLITAIMWSDFIEKTNITNLPNHQLILLLKRALPALRDIDGHIAFDYRQQLKSNINKYLNFISIENMKLLLDYLDKLLIFHSIETGDGLVSELPIFSYIATLYTLAPRDLDELPRLCAHVLVSDKDLVCIPTAIESDNDVSPDLPLVSLQGHLNKAISYPTTSQYKLLSILKSFSVLVSSDQHIGCFGDGAGGFSKLMIDIYQTYVFYNSLIDTANLFQNALGNQYPPCFAGSPIERSYLVGLDFTYQYLNDLTHPNYAELYIRYVGQKLWGIICDAEGGGWKDTDKAVRMLKNLLKIAFFSGSELLVFKTYYSNWKGFKSQILLIKILYQHVYIARSFFSSQGSTEVYLIGMNPVEDKRQIVIGDFFNVSNSKIHIPFSLIPGFDDIRKILIDRSMQTALPDHAKKYTKFLSSTRHEKQAMLSLLSLSQTLFDRDNYKFPSHYLQDSRRNTHLVKFSNKERKITKINCLTQSLVIRLITGYLILLCSYGPFSNYESIDRIINYGVMVFYQSYKHYWSFALAQIDDVKDCSFKYYRIIHFVNSTKKKEILSQIAKVRNYQANITYYFVSSRFPYTSPFRPQDNNYVFRSIKFHEGFTPLQLAEDNEINHKVLRIPKYFLKPHWVLHYKNLQERWVQQQHLFKQSNDWVSYNHVFEKKEQK